MRDVRQMSFPNAELIFDKDDRVKVLNVDDPPWRQVCALRIEAPTGQSYGGTGWILGPHTVATAGHCVYFPSLKSWATKIEVIVAQSGPGTGRSFVSSEFRSTNSWTHGEPSPIDVGLIVLKEPIGEQFGSFSFAAMSDDELKDAMITISGYPADLDDGRYQYNDSMKLGSADGDGLQYVVDTYGGQSGAPILMNLKSGRTVVGIHVGGNTTNNVGVRLTRDVFELFRTWKSYGRLNGQ